MLVFPCEICSINESQIFLTRCCKLFICEICKVKYETNCSQCVCLKTITNKKLCTENQILHKLILDYINKKEKQCGRCTQIAKIQCKNCNMVFCKSCEKQLHNAIGYSKHLRQPYVEKPKDLRQVIENIKHKIKICENHKQIIEIVCQCGCYLCNQCIKIHKDSCQKMPLKPKLLSQFRTQFYSNLLHKITQITNYKQSLQSEISQFSNQFAKQKQSFEVTQKAIEQQFSALKKMLEIKMEQSQNRLNQYWNECQKVYNKTLFYLESNMRKYDDYARLITEFAQHQVGLDYLEKRIKKFPPLAYNGFFFKVNGIDDVRNTVLNLSSSFKLWEFQFHENIMLNLEETQEERKLPSQMKIADFLTTNTSQLLYEVNQNPLKPRSMQFSSSHNEIQFTFLHLPYQTYKYEIQYGVGFKMKGKQVFKKIQNSTGKGYIQGLNPSTKYRIRMRVGDGQFGEINEVSTLDSPKFLVQVGNTMKSTSENSFQFYKQGVIYGSNPLTFGIHTWTVILNSEKSSYDESQTACITVGISNKEQKKPHFVGSTFNYGYQRDQIIVKLTVNCQQQTMIITNSQNNQSQQKFCNLPQFPIFPSIQNKSNATIHIKYNFGKQENF